MQSSQSYNATLNINDSNFGTIPFEKGAQFAIQHIEGKGRGVIACSRIPKDTAFMCDAVERYSGSNAQQLRSHELYYHLFVDPALYRKSGNIDLLWAIGPISIVNHSRYPNCVVEWHRDNNCEWAVLISTRDIYANEELTISYTNIEEYLDYQEFV